MKTSRIVATASTAMLCALVASQAFGTEPKTGGVLKLVGAGDVPSFDPTSARSASLFLHRALTRTLLAFPTSADPAIAGKPVGDLAEAVPAAEEGGLAYTIKIRPGAQWASEPARQITAADAARGFKRLCNPVQPTYAPTYFVGIISGMEEFCAGFAAVPAEIGAIRDYVEGNQISGVEVVDDLTLRIKLEKPTPDFLSILALTASAPVAVEMLDYLPNSPDFRRNYVSSGPYKIDEYIVGESISLDRNPNWSAEADPLRKAYVDGIEVAFGTPDAGKTQRMIEAGDIDGYFDLSIATADLTRIMANPDDPQLLQFADGAVNPILVLNIQSPNNNSALADVRVRQAINYAANKAAIVQVGGGPAVKEATNQVLTSSVLGYEAFNLYPTEGNQGDVEKAKALMAEAGFPDGLELKFSYAAGGRYDLYAAALQADFAKANIRLVMQPAPSRTVYSQMYQNKEAVKAGAWDIGMTNIKPDWVGDAARTMVVPMFHGEACETSSTNWTCYNNPEVNALIEKALTAESPEAAAASWKEADRLIMADAPVIPLITGKISLYGSKRLRNTDINLLFNNVDPTLVWLDQ